MFRPRSDEVRQGLGEIKHWKKISPGHQKERVLTAGVSNRALGPQSPQQQRGWQLTKILREIRGRSKRIQTTEGMRPEGAWREVGEEEKGQKEIGLRGSQAALLLLKWVLGGIRLECSAAGPEAWGSAAGAQGRRQG